MYLESAVGSRTRVKILRTLCQDGFPQLDAGSLVDETGKSRSGIHKALGELVDTGLLVEVRRGRKHYYAIDRDHPWARSLADLFRVERTRDNVPHLFPAYWNRLEDVTRDLARRQGVSFVLLFGSMTRSPIEPTADIDLFLGLDAEAETPSVDEGILGREVSIVGMEVDRFAEKLEASDPFAEAVAERNVVLHRDARADPTELPNKLLGIPSRRYGRGP